MLKWATGAVVLWMGLQVFETRCVGLMPILYSHSDKTKMIATSPLKIFFPPYLQYVPALPCEI